MGTCSKRTVLQTKAERDNFPLGKESLEVLKASACSKGMMTQQCPVYQIPCQICPGLFVWLKARGHCDTSFTHSVRIMGFLPSCVLSCAGSQVPAVITHTWTQGSGRQDQVRLSPSQTQPEEVSSLVCSQKRFQDPWRLSQVGPHVGSLGYVYTKKGCFISRGASVYKCPQPLSSWQTKVWAYF